MVKIMFKPIPKYDLEGTLLPHPPWHESPDEQSQLNDHIPACGRQAIDY
jgi:hypothetical protein